MDTHTLEIDTSMTPFFHTIFKWFLKRILFFGWEGGCKMWAKNNFLCFPGFFYLAKLDVIFFLQTYLHLIYVLKSGKCKYVWWKNIYGVHKYFSTFFPLFSPSKTLVIFTKKPKNLKKTFCFNFYPCQSSAKCFHIWFEISKVTSVEKREPRKHFSASICSFLGLGLWPRLRKTFPWFPFFYFGNLGKTQIRRGKILFQTCHGKKSKQNTIV